MSNPLESVANIYKDFVEKADSRGLAEVYKRATEVLFKALKKELKKYKDFKIHITDVEYLNGYFIFGMGTNSVVHFYIKETPGWKYGIWWEPVEAKESTEENPLYETNRVRCRIFTQYEEEIDKFKPSASMVTDEFNIYLDSASTDFAWEFAKDIKFIHDEPYLAFYREMHYTDFNKEYISRETAKEYFEEHYKQKKLEEEIKALNDKELLKTIYDILKEDFDDRNCFIYDRGESWHPRYEIVAKNTFDVEDGCYGLSDLFDEPTSTVVQNIFNTKVKECEKRADDAGFSWYTCCHDSVVMVSEDRFEKAFTECEKVEFTTEEI
jgi:hypothetical protein